MKKNSLFYINKKRKVKDLLVQMDTIQVQNQRKQLKKIITDRKNKVRQILSMQSVSQKPHFKPLRRDYSQFIISQPISKNQPFITQKMKRKLETSDRAFSSSPNMKVGSTNILTKIKLQVQDKEIINGKFKQYDRLLDQQSGPLKKQTLQKLKLIQRKNVPNQTNMMKKTYFQKFASDRFNFYDSNNYSSIKTSILSKSRTDREIQTIHKMSKIKINNSIIDTNESQEQSFIKYLNKSRLNKSLKKQYQSLILQSSRSRINISSSKLLQPISLQKNINSIQY